MSHDIENNLYDIEIVNEEIFDNKHAMRVKTIVDGEEYAKNFSFTHDQTPGGSLNSWKKHIKRWIDNLKKNDDRNKITEEKGSKVKLDE